MPEVSKWAISPSKPRTSCHQSGAKHQARGNSHAQRGFDGNDAFVTAALEEGLTAELRRGT